MAEDMKYVVDIVDTCKSLKAIDLQSNRINLSGLSEKEALSSIFTTNSSIQINFNGNYCESDRDTLTFVYKSSNIALINGYVWIYEAWLEESSWYQLLKTIDLSDSFEVIKTAHKAFFAKRKMYSND